MSRSPGFYDELSLSIELFLLWNNQSQVLGTEHESLKVGGRMAINQPMCQGRLLPGCPLAPHIGRTSLVYL